MSSDILLERSRSRVLHCQYKTIDTLCDTLYESLTNIVLLQGNETTITKGHER